MFRCNQQCTPFIGSVDKYWGHRNKKHNPVGTWYFTSAHNCNIILNINHLARTRSIASLPCKIVLGDVIQTSFQEILLSSGVFRRETVSGFYPWGNVDSPRKRAALVMRHGRFKLLFQTKGTVLLVCLWHTNQKNRPFGLRRIFRKSGGESRPNHLHPSPTHS